MLRARTGPKGPTGRRPAGASHTIVYGLYPATAPLMIVGLVSAANAAGREDWPMVGITLPVAIDGVATEDISHLVGHASTRTTERSTGTSYGPSCAPAPSP
jgi:hypothetical protein